MQLSRLVDGDLPEAERDALIDALLADGELAERWKRYHAIGDLMRDGGIGADISARVRAALDAGAHSGADVVVPFSARLNPRGWLKPPGSVHARPALGLALAASVALGTVVGLRVLMPDQGGGPAVATAGSGTKPAAEFGQNVLPAGFGTLGGSTPVARADFAGSPQGAMPAGAAVQPGQGGDMRLADYLEQHRREVQTSMLGGQETLGAVESPP
jgi:anti-sigma factor RsiW